MQVIVDELLTHYELSGAGRLVLLLHGWGDNAKGLSGLQTSLAEHYQVLALDLPGFGDSQPPQVAWNLDNYADFLEHACTKLQLQPYAVVGHSNGGALAVRAVAIGRLRPQKLVLLAASGIRSGQSTKRLALKIVAKVGNAATIWLPEHYRRTLRQTLYGVAGSDMLVAPQLQETFKLTVAQDVQADAAMLKLPTLLIYAQADRAVPMSDGRRFHHLIAGSRLEILPAAGHFVHLDQAVKVLQLIGDFLA